MNKEKPDVAERSSEASLLTGKYVYSRRRKFGRKKSGPFFKSLTMGDSDHPKQASKRSRRGYTLKNAHQAAQVETIISNLEKKVPEPNTNASILGEKGSTLHICSQTSEKVARSIQGNLFSSLLILQSES